MPRDLAPAATVGRQAELEIARSAVAGVTRGAPGMLLIEGEAGIGKSHLIAHVVGEATARGVTSVGGAAHPFEANRPFGLVADAFDLRPRSNDTRRADLGRLLVGEAAPAAPGAGLPPADTRFRVQEQVLELIDAICSEGPLLVTLEDLHWADDASLSLFSSVIHQLSHAPLLMVATLRPAPRTPALDVLVDDCLATGGRRLQLGSLPSAEVDALVVSQLGSPAGPLLSSIVGRAAGNPLWIVEALRSLAAEGWLRDENGRIEAAGDELPGTLRDLVLRRLRYLPSGALDVLQVTAILGESVPVRDLSAVSGRAPRQVVEDLAEAFRARLLDEREDELVFRHQLVQQAIYEDLPLPVRRALHRDAAGALARAGAELPTVASHLLRGAERGDLEAVRWLRSAAAEAAGGAPSVAVDLVRRAGELLPEGHRDADLLSAELAAALLRAGKVVESSEVAASVLDRPHRDDVDVALRLTLVDSLSLQNRPRELIARTEAALSSSALRPADRALVLTQASYGQTFSGDFTGGEATARRALEMAERADSLPMTVWSLSGISVAVRVQGRYAEGLSHARRAVELAFEPGDPEARRRHPHFFLGMAQADCDRFAEALDAHRQAIDDAEEIGSGWLLPDMLALSAEVHFLTGSWDDAETELDAAVRLAEQQGQRISIPQSRAYQALMALARGDIQTPRGLLDDLEPMLLMEDRPYGASMVAVAVAARAEAEGDPRSALEVLKRTWDQDAQREVRYYHRYLGPSLVRLAMALGRRDTAEEIAAAMDEGVRLAPEVASVKSAALRCRGFLDSDPAVFLLAVDHARRGQRVLDLTATCEEAADALVAAGQAETATELLKEAQRHYERLDATAGLARVGAGLRKLGVRQGARGARRRPEHGWESLTPSELAVAELAAEGLTNRDVARRLHVSPHTVNTHLRRIFQKLTVTTRAELAAKAAQITHSSDVSTVVESAL